MGAAGRRVTIRFHEYCGKPYLVDFFLRMKYIHTWYASSRWQAEVQYAPKQASERGTDIALSTRATQISASAKGPVFCFRFRFCFRFFVFFRLAPPLITKHRTGLRTPKSPTHVRAAQNNVSASYERTRSVRFAKKKTKKNKRWIEAEREEALLGEGAKYSGESVRHDEKAFLAFGAGPRVCPGQVRMQSRI